MTELVFDNVGKLFTRADKNGLTHAISDVSFEAKEKEFISTIKNHRNRRGKRSTGEDSQQTIWLWQYLLHSLYH